MTQRTHCINHCSACDAHYASTEAFELHRTGSHYDGTRHCIEPLDDWRFAPKSETGVCDVGRNFNAPRLGVTVWSLRVALERGRVRYGEREAA